jgi:hypothetical protein
MRKKEQRESKYIQFEEREEVAERKSDRPAERQKLFSIAKLTVIVRRQSSAEIR